MSIILSLETSTEVCSVAIHNDGTLLSYLEIHIIKSHAEKITLLIEEALRLANLELKTIDAIALSMGPGSYTGLRVGTSTAKGLALALDKPIIAISTLKAMATEINCFNLNKSLMCPMIDARRMEVYCGLFDIELNEELPVDALILDSSSFQQQLEDKAIIFFGNGSNKFKEILNNSNAYFINAIYPKALFIGQLAFENYKKQLFVELDNFEPFYLKDFVLNKSS